MNAEIELSWQSTPALWMAYRRGQCFCEECSYKATVGLGKTKEAATAELIEKEREADVRDETLEERRFMGSAYK